MGECVAARDAELATPHKELANALTQGNGDMEVDGGEPTSVSPGDVVEIPAGVSQRITNTGDDDLLFFCVCLPRFTPDCYESLEEA